MDVLAFTRIWHYFHQLIRWCLIYENLFFGYMKFFPGFTKKNSLLGNILMGIALITQFIRDEWLTWIDIMRFFHITPITHRSRLCTSLDVGLLCLQHGLIVTLDCQSLFIIGNGIKCEIITLVFVRNFDCDVVQPWVLFRLSNCANP